MSTYSLSPAERLQLQLHVLPQHVGALRELIALEGLREKAEFSEEEKEQIGFVEERGRVGITDQAGADELGEKTLDLTDEEEEIVALGFRLLEAKAERRGEPSIPTNRAFTSLFLKFREAVEESIGGEEG